MLANPNEMRRERARQQSSKAAILSLLRAAGPTGQTNGELNHVSFRYGARILELRQAGHDIESLNEGEGGWRFVLHEPARVRPGQSGYLASLAPITTITPDTTPAATGRLF